MRRRRRRRTPTVPTARRCVDRSGDRRAGRRRGPPGILRTGCAASVAWRRAASTPTTRPVSSTRTRAPVRSSSSSTAGSARVGLGQGGHGADTAAPGGARIRRRLYRTELTADPATDFARESTTFSPWPRCSPSRSSSSAIRPGRSSCWRPWCRTAPRSGLCRLRAAARPRRADRWRDRCGRRPCSARAGAIRHGAADLRHPCGWDACGGGLADALFVRLSPKVRPFVPRQIDDTEAINRLGARLDAYGSITVPVLLLTASGRPPTCANAPNGWPRSPRCSPGGGHA